MLTPRAWWFVVLVSSVLAVALFCSHLPFLVFGLMLLSWFLVEWLLFAVRGRWAQHRIRFFARCARLRSSARPPGRS